MTGLFTPVKNSGQGGTLTVFSVTGTAAAVGTVTLPRGASSVNSRHGLHTMIISGLGSETIALTGSTDGTNFSASLLPLDYTASTGTGNYVAAATLGNGTFKIPYSWPFSSYKFVKSSTSDTANVTFAAFTVPK